MQRIRDWLLINVGDVCKPRLSNEVRSGRRVEVLGHRGSGYLDPCTVLP
jgi:hypothetical protein